jgi:predicted GNAT family N-acyltransferase
MELYEVSAASLAFERLTEADRNGVPAYPVPAVRIGRLASSLSFRGLGLGELLLQNAIKRILQARNTLGVHAVLVEAKHSAAESFYRKYGFRLCDPKSRQLYLPLGVD